MGSRWLAGCKGLPPALAAAVLVPAMVAAASGPAHPAAADSPATGHAATAGVIATVAGGVGGPARATKVGLEPCGVSSGNGSLYVAGGLSVRKVSPVTDALTTPAGIGARGPVADGGPATRASFSTCGAAVDSAGNLLVADIENYRLRVVAAQTGTFYGQVMTAGHIYTIAGTGKRGFSGDGGPATSAEMDGPVAVALDAAGNVVIDDYFNGRIRVVAERTGAFYGQAMTAGNIYTVAGGGTSGLGDGGPATSATLFGARGVTVDAAGNLVIADTQDSRVRVVAVHTGTFYGQAMTAGDIYTVAGTGVPGFSGDGGPAAKAKLSTPGSVAVDAAGNLLIADQGTSRVRLVASKSGTFYGQAMTADHIYTVAGDGTAGYSGDLGPATGAELDSPEGVAVDAAGNLLIADFSNGRVRLVAETSGTFYGQAMTVGDIYTVAGHGRPGYSGDGGPATHAQLGTQLEVQAGLAVDAAGSVLIADNANDRVRLVAAKTGTFYGQAMTAGDIYTVAGDGRARYSGDGGPATKAGLDDPTDAAVGAAGNILIADFGDSRVRLVAVTSGTFFGQAMTAGDIYTVAGDGTAGYSGDGGLATAAELSGPEGVAVDAAGNVVIVDAGNNRLRVVAAKTGTFYGQAMTAGHIYTVAGGGTGGDGGPATQALLDSPEGVAVDAAGNLVLADTLHQRIRVVAVKSGTFYGQKMTAGDIYAIAGNGRHLFGGDGGPALEAELDWPASVAVDGAGNVAIADLRNNRVRVVAAKTGTFYGVAMTAGDIYTVAGDGFGGYFGDGNQATKAELDSPAGVAAGPDGSLLIADNGSGRVRAVTG